MASQFPKWTQSVRNSFQYLLRGPGSSGPSPTVLYSPSPQPPTDTATPLSPRPSSLAFDSHIEEGASSARPSSNGKGKTNQAISLAWDENEGRGIASDMRQYNGMSERERKETLLAACLSNPWVSACVDVIAKRITSGGMAIEPVQQGVGSDANREKLRQFCLLINDNWDFLQFVRSIIMDLLIFGEAYCEVLLKDGVPWKLFKVDCLTMTYKLDPHGQILGYEQQLSSTSKKNLLPAETIIRWWFPHPRACMTALSPIERILDAVNIDGKMVKWVTTFFQKGAKAPYWIKTGLQEAEATRFLTWFRENFTGEKNAHVPVTTWGDTELREFKSGAIDIDFLQGRKTNREEVLAGYNVPPAIVGIIESGNIGGGSGEDQEKSFQYNTCDPIKQSFFEKFNYVLVQKLFGITDYLVTTRYADYRADKDVAEVQDKRIRNGTMTINEIRQEMGKLPYKSGGDVAIVVTTKEITPVPRFDDLEDEQKQATALTLQQQAAQADLAKTQAQKAKEPPEPVPVALQQHLAGQQNGQPGQPPLQGKQSGGQLGPDGSMDNSQKEALQEDSDATKGIWEPDDIEGQLADLKAQGYTHVTWEDGSNGGCLEICAQNSGVKVPLGEQFPSLHRLAPAHPFCGCTTVPSKEGG